MKMHIREFAKLTGVSVRTLHYYDEIGLLNPSFVDEQNGYRSYDERSLERMQEILFYRELDFSLKSIAEILSSPNYNKRKALIEQKRLLTLKKDRLERLIKALDSAVKGEIVVNLNLKRLVKNMHRKLKKSGEIQIHTRNIQKRLHLIQSQNGI